MTQQEDFFALTYFGPISYYSAIIRNNNWNFDLSEKFKKQTYRSRCEILGANGKLNLIIPINHNEDKNISKITISYDEDWRKIHMKSLQSAYLRSPFFEYYEHLFLDFYKKEFNLLCNLLLETNILIKKMLKQNNPVVELKNKGDLKGKLNRKADFYPKNKNKKILDKYFQVFSEKIEFQNDLSILDLIFNLGPELAIDYLIKQHLSKTL